MWTVIPVEHLSSHPDLGKSSLLLLNKLRGCYLLWVFARNAAGLGGFAELSLSLEGHLVLFKFYLDFLKLKSQVALTLIQMNIIDSQMITFLLPVILSGKSSCFSQIMEILLRYWREIV